MVLQFSKLRVAEKTVAQALNAQMDYGRLVHCAYDDMAFKKCVPSDHRHQMLHQAFVANFGIGVYVVAMSDDVVGGKILQIVVVYAL
jgi:hypothetical protein